MYLSKLKLNPRSRDVRRDLADCHNLHRTLLSAFPQAGADAARAEFGLLFRLEANLRTGMIVVLAQSHVEPDWSHLPAGYLLDAADNPACKPIDAMYESLASGARLLFRLRANPTRKIETKSLPDGTKRNGRRVELRGEEDQIAWLRRKSEAAGFRLLNLRLNTNVPNLRTSPETKTVGWRSHREGSSEKQRLTFGAVLFEGEMEITDATAFRQALAQGIGSGKAYGFGLLSIAPLRQ
jgi:CRISPR system Cascade subunit CasE